jgi:hypothetical protein
VNKNNNYNTSRITNVYCTNFLGLTLDSTLSWKPHIDQLLPKLNLACSVIRSLKSIISLGNLSTIYFSTVHSIISYGIIFGDNSTYSNIIFKIQKTVISIMMNVGNSESCRELLKNLNILPLQSQYIFSLLLFVVKTLHMFKSNSVVHTINTRNSSDLYLPSVHLSKVQKAVYYSGIKVFNCVPSKIKSSSSDVRKCRSALKRFLLEGSFYTIQEYFDCNLMTNPSISY